VNVRGALLAVSVIAGCSFTPGKLPPIDDAPVAQDAVDGAPPIDAPPDVAIDAKPPNFHLHVEADIDGKSNLIVKGTNVHWHHYEYAAPGREGGTNLPTVLDTVNWQPVWPDQPTAENRYCNCDSSTYSQLTIGVPRAPSTTTLSNIVKRVSITVVKEPSFANDYTLELELNDVGASGSSTYKVDIDVVVQ
jgi:hypothetical protein